jgi:hypothetical protein
VSRVRDIETWKEDFAKRASLFHKVFSSTDGKKVLSMILDTFNAGSVFDENPYKMAKNAGQHDMAEYLKILVERGSKDV